MKDGNYEDQAHSPLEKSKEAASPSGVAILRGLIIEYGLKFPHREMFKNARNVRETS